MESVIPGVLVQTAQRLEILRQRLVDGTLDVVRLHSKHGIDYLIDSLLQLLF